jgi:hypothetical protein
MGWRRSLPAYSKRDDAIAADNSARKSCRAGCWNSKTYGRWFGADARADDLSEGVDGTGTEQMQVESAGINEFHVDVPELGLTGARGGLSRIDLR